MSDKNNLPMLGDFKKAIENLEEVLILAKTDIIRDSAIKRFEICYDLAWKAIKNRAKDEGMECFSPRSCVKMAFQLKLIDYDEKWLKMIDDRNLTAHLYKKEYAEQVYSRLKDYLELFKKLYGNFE